VARAELSEKLNDRTPALSFRRAKRGEILHYVAQRFPPALARGANVASARNDNAKEASDTLLAVKKGSEE